MIVIQRQKNGFWFEAPTLFGLGVVSDTDNSDTYNYTELRDFVKLWCMCIFHLAPCKYCDK